MKAHYEHLDFWAAITHIMTTDDPSPGTLKVLNAAVKRKQLTLQKVFNMSDEALLDSLPSLQASDIIAFRLAFGRPE